jgi:hypothetical protein
MFLAINSDPYIFIDLYALHICMYLKYQMERLKFLLLFVGMTATGQHNYVALMSHGIPG